MSFTSSFPAFINSKTGVSSPFSLGGSIKDLKSSLKVSLTSTLPSGFAVVKAGVVIDKWLKTTNSAPTDVSWFFTNGNAKFIVGPTDSADVVYSNFVSGDSYRILFQVSVRDTNGATVMYQCAYKFNYLNPVPTFTNFSFNNNVASGDDINVTGLTIMSPSPFPGDIPAEVSFEFNELELRIGDVNDENNNGYNPVLAYNPSGNYTLSSNELQNDNFYEVTAIISWESGYSTYVNSSQQLFVIARPSINDVVPYDAQNDGGNDGVHFNPPSSDIDTSDQIIATITLNPVGYENYLPSQVKFVFFDSNNNEIGSSDNAYDAVSTNLQSYNITLDSVILVNSSTPLLNGLPGYTVKAIVIVPIVIGGTTYPEQERSSDPKSVVFKQGVAPILPLTIGNTWDLVCNSNPSSAAALYNSSPVLGISGHFLKNAQFMSGYSRNLDNTATKFLLQYTLNGGAAQNVVSAALVQQGSEALQQTMINAMNSLVSSPNGQYVNVVGPSGVVGSSQKPLVFYIPKVQGSVTFGESDVVNVVVTIIDSDNEWVDSPATVSNTSSPVSTVNGVTMVNKIATYSYTSADAGSAMEPFIANVDVTNNVVSVLTDNVLSTVLKTDVIADSAASMITQAAKGWTVVNPAAVNGVVPKVNLYYYAKGTSPSFTMGQVNQSSDLGMWYVINQNTGAKQYPFLIAYTDSTQAPTSTNKASWYKSKIFYAPTTSSANPNPDPTQSGFTLLYTGNDDGSLYPEIPSNRRVQLVVNAGLSNKNTDVSNELVAGVNIQTSSNAASTAAGDFNFTLLYAGIIRTGSYTTTLFTDPLLNVNIPVNNSFSSYFNSSIVNNLNTPSGGFVIEKNSSTSTSSFVLPLLTQNAYNVQYSIQNPNNSNAVVKGLVSADTTISTLNEPQLTDFTVSNFDYNTVNDDQKSSIVFDLTIAPYVLDRIDGVHVYFTSDSNSNISSTLIGTFTASQSGCEISLSSLSSWNPYTSGTITFVPFRDNRVDSHVDETENLLATWTAPTVWNIPAINKPSVSGPITLTGGVVNSSDNTVLNWVNDTGSAYAYPVAFTYTLTMSMYPASANSVQYTTAAAAASAILVLAANTTNAYYLELKKVFNGQSSDADTIVFDSVKVDTSVMVVSVLNPSNLTSVKASWVAPDITGTDSSFANNVASLCLTDNGAPLRTVTASTIETSGGSYSITNVMGTTLQLCMSVTAYVQYFINSGVSANSSTVSLPLGNTTQYTVSTVPNVALSSATSTVLIQDTATPSLLLNLDAKGLEVEGFISLVVVLTQDGTDAKPEGCEVLLQFPSAPTSSNPFLFPNTVGGAGSGSANLVGAESSTVAPLNLVPTNLSTNVGNYTLTIGSPNTSGANVGRYGLSSLTFPAGSGFANGQETNIMAILSSRRGTDVMVGSFTFVTPPVASNVSVTTVNGQYVLSFNLA